MGRDVTKEDLQWLRQRLRKAIWGCILVSVLAFGAGVSFLSTNGVVDTTGALVMAIGMGLGLLVSRVPHSGLEWVLLKKTPLRLSEGEALAQLKPYWDRFPRLYGWIAAIPYLVILALRARMQVPVIVDYSIRYLWWWGIIGMGSSMFLFYGVFYAYAYLEMGKRLSNSGDRH